MKIARYWRYVLAMILVVGLVLFAGRPALPPLDGRSVSSALSPADAHDTTLGRALWPMVQAHPGKSGIFSLADAHDAFAARVLLTRSAEKTLDIQSYIWHDDVTGSLLIEELRAAADRGVRVRLLLDDNGTSGLDEKLAALDSHPNIEVRLFNPFVVRNPKAIGFLVDFSRSNRRMHNKSFTADNQSTIIGGRNIGDEYFGAASVLFADLDVLAVGSAVDDVSRDFDLYWGSESSYPVDRIVPKASSSALLDLAKVGELVVASTAAGEYTAAVRRAQFLAGLMDGSLQFEWADTKMVSDDPAKGLGKATKDSMLLSQLRDMLGKPDKSVDLVSPYFVPTALGVEIFAAMEKDGIRVRVLTNSLAATDVAAVHAGYVKRRKDILKSGVSLYEMRRTSQGGGSNSGSGPFGSSGSSLHAKTFAVDSKRVFVGSFNFDPRSARFNTELGFIIESPRMAREIEASFETDIPKSAYVVELTDRGDIAWIELRDGVEIRHDREPETGPLKRGFVWLLSRLPIEWML